MKCLIVEDDYITSQVMKEILSPYGDVDIAENGKEAIELFNSSFIEDVPYQVVFLDIMMPEFDGQEVLARIRKIEEEFGVLGLDGVKIVMTTALDDFSNIKNAFMHQCEDYIVKPIEKVKVVNALIKLGLA